MQATVSMRRKPSEDPEERSLRRSSVRFIPPVRWVWPGFPRDCPASRQVLDSAGSSATGGASEQTEAPMKHGSTAMPPSGALAWHTISRLSKRLTCGAASLKASSHRSGAFASIDSA